MVLDPCFEVCFMLSTFVGVAEVEAPDTTGLFHAHSFNRDHHIFHYDDQRGDARHHRGVR